MNQGRLVCYIVIAIAMALPAFTRANAAFYDDLRGNLATSSEAVPVGVRANAAQGGPPPLGTAEGAEERGKTALADATGASAYVAGRDAWSGPVAGVAVVLAIGVIGLVFWFALGHRG